MSQLPPSHDAKPKRRKRKTKAEREAELAAEMAKPIDPRVWILLGGLILFVALCILVDPVGFAEAGQPKDQGILYLIPLLLIRIFGKNLAVLIITVLGVVPLLWGIIGWLRSRVTTQSAEAE
jgi:hypothetical protein